MFCRYCGQEIDNNSVFCRICGMSLSETSNEYKEEKEEYLKHEEINSNPKTPRNKNKIAIILAIAIPILLAAIINQSVLLSGGNSSSSNYGEEIAQKEKELELAKENLEEAKGGISSSSGKLSGKEEEARREIESVINNNSLSKNEKEEKLYKIKMSFGQAVFTTAVKHIPVYDPNDGKWKTLDNLAKDMVRDGDVYTEGNPLYDDPVGTASELLFGDGFADKDFIDSVTGGNTAYSNDSDSSGGWTNAQQE